MMMVMMVMMRLLLVMWLGEQVDFSGTVVRRLNSLGAIDNLVDAFVQMAMSGLIVFLMDVVFGVIIVRICRRITKRARRV